tara:strand:- start:380 stop:586 length:207 start_codon:yes stop_codon:yes gene_type:complete
MSWLKMLVSVNWRGLATMGERIVGNLDTAQERKEAIAFCVGKLSDGKVTCAEWSQIGSKFGVLKGPKQ